MSGTVALPFIRPEHRSRASHGRVRSTLTVLIPCKDEIRNIRTCIESVQGMADEILVADSGSTDGTLEVVREIGGCRIIERQYVNAGDFKSWAFPQAQSEWVLMLDADERITPALREEIQQSISRPDAADGYLICRDNYFMGHLVSHGPWGVDRSLRLFRRRVAKCVGETDHAEFAVPGRVGRLRNRMPHFTCWNYDEFIAKQVHYCKQQAELWYRSGRRPSYFRLFMTAAFRFIHIYLVRGGFLDGAVGFQIAVHIAYFSFLKQARLWQLHHGRVQPDPEEERRQRLPEPSPSSKNWSPREFRPRYQAAQH